MTGSGCVGMASGHSQEEVGVCEEEGEGYCSTQSFKECSRILFQQAYSLLAQGPGGLEA
jgi:hypothetical protein